MQTLSYESTVLSCFVAYIVQAIVINFVPLLFVTFQNDFGISLGEVTLLITFNFLIQLGVDFLSAYFVDRVGYRISLIAAHLFAAAGLLFISELPFIMDNAYVAPLVFEPTTITASADLEGVEADALGIYQVKNFSWK